MRRGSRLPRGPERPNRGNRAWRNVIVTLGGAAAGGGGRDNITISFCLAS